MGFNYLDVIAQSTEKYRRSLFYMISILIFGTFYSYSQEVTLNDVLEAEKRIIEGNIERTLVDFYLPSEIESKAFSYELKGGFVISIDDSLIEIPITGTFIETDNFFYYMDVQIGSFEGLNSNCFRLYRFDKQWNIQYIFLFENLTPKIVTKLEKRSNSYMEYDMFIRSSHDYTDAILNFNDYRLDDIDNVLINQSCGLNLKIADLNALSVILNLPLKELGIGF